VICLTHASRTTLREGSGERVSNAREFPLQSGIDISSFGKRVSFFERQYEYRIAPRSIAPGSINRIWVGCLVSLATKGPPSSL
jgi:hypothetical protein